MSYSPALQEAGYFLALVLRSSVGSQSDGDSQADENFSEGFDYLAACRVAKWKLIDNWPARKSVHVHEEVSASMREYVGRDIFEDSRWWRVVYDRFLRQA